MRNPLQPGYGRSRNAPGAQPRCAFCERGFICRRAAPAARPGGHVASVRLWSAAIHIVDTAVGHDTDSHDTDIGREDPTVAPPVPGRWRSAAKTGRRRAGLLARLR